MTQSVTPLSLLAVCGALALAACASSDAALRRVVVDTTAGVVHVHNPERAPHWQLTLVGTLGAANGAGDSTGIVMASGITVDSAGNVYVADARRDVVRVFAPDGQLVRTIARPGTGIGQLRHPLGIGWLGDTLVVLDAGNARLALFARDGAWLGAWPHAYVSGAPALVTGEPGRELYARVEGAPSLGVGAWYRRVTAAGPTGDTIRTPRGAESPPASVVCFGSSGIATFEIPFAPQRVFTFASGGRTLEGLDTHYHIVMVNERGDTVRVIERRSVEIAAPKEVWQRASENLTRYQRQHGHAHCSPPEIPRVSTEPILRAIFTDADGRIWVERRMAQGESNAPRQDTGGGAADRALDAAPRAVPSDTAGRDALETAGTFVPDAVLDVLDAEGKLLGTAPAPFRQLAVEPYAKGNRLYVLADASRGQVVRIYEIRRDSAAAAPAPSR